MVTGWLPAVLTIFGGGILLALIVWPAQLAWWRRAAALVAAAGLVVIAANLFITKVWRPFPDSLPPIVLVWAWLGVSGLVLGVAQLFRHWKTGLAALLAGVLVFITIAGTQINRFYGQYPTVGTALGITRPELTDLSLVDRASNLVTVPDNGYLAEVWDPAEPVPSKGIIARVRIDPNASGFRARPAYVYLPPAYSKKNPRPLLPILVLLAGQPGNADAWLVSGQLAKMMDSYAGSHKGLAPIVVMPDNIGSNFANPLCADTKYGNAESYLAVDVPAWIKANLQAAEGPVHWAIAGLSNGGTCSLQMATRHPELYGRFIDISGEYEPLDDAKDETVRKYFNGDNEAYSRISPVEIMKQHRFPQTAGRIVVGQGDHTYNGQLKRVLEMCVAAGMDMTFLELPGGHTWQVWAPGLRDSLGWLAAKTGLVRE